MINDNDDMRWVKAQRPPVAPPDAETTLWAREALLAHAKKASHLAAVRAPSVRPSAPRRFSGLLKGRRAVAAAAAVAIMATAGITAALVGIPHTGDTGLLSGVATAQAKTLLALSSRVLAAPAPPGDATLVQHTNKLAFGTFTGADLYLDNGRYYYADTAAGLPAAVKGGPQDYDLKPAIDAAASVASAGPQTARAAFLQAISSSLYPKIGLLSATRAQQDNYIWITAIDALGAADGRPAVLAGMLKVLSTVDGLTVAHDTYQGQSVLELTLTIHVVPASPETLRKDAAKTTDAGVREKLEAAAKQRASHPQAPYTDVETLTLNDQTGALLVYQDQGPGGEGVTVTYHVSRVDAANYGLR